MIFIERKTQNFILEFREIFPWRDTVLGAHGIKSDGKPFFCQIYAILEYVIIDRYCSKISEGFGFFLTQAITDGSFKSN